MPRMSLIALVLGSTLLACSSEPAPSASASAAASEATPPTPPAPPRPPPDDLPLEPLREALACPQVEPDKAKGACRVLAMAATCKPWSGLAQSGEGRYLGRGFTVEGPKREERQVLLRTRTVPLVEVGPSELNAKLAISLVPRDDPGKSNAERAIKAYERFDVPARSNPAVSWVKAYDAFEELPAMRTVSGKVLILADSHATVCEGEQQRLYLVHPSGPTGKKGDGLYAELWPVSW